MRLIDEDKAKEVLKKLLYETALNNTGDFSIMCVNIAQERLDTWLGLVPTADAVPVRHGRWIYKGVRGRFPVCECSVCGNTENADWAVLGDNVNYCPNCGAKMDVEEQDETN